MPETMPKLRALADEAKRRGSSVWLQVDGGIGEATIAQAAEAGADTSSRVPRCSAPTTPTARSSRCAPPPPATATDRAFVTAPSRPATTPPPSTRYPGGVKTFDDLFAELSAKAVERPEGSGTVAQLDAGVHAIGKKIVEEAAEVWMAAEYESDEAAAEEISQLLYHLQTLMLAKGLSLEDVYRHL